MTAIHILFAFDDNFWAPAYAAMRGICLSTHRRGDLVFHLCELGLTGEHRADLEKITTEFGAKLVFYDLATNRDFQERCANLPSDKRLNQMMYARLLVDVLIPKDVKRIIYFDCDTYVRAPIEELAEIDLQGFPIGAVEEPHADFITRQTDMRHNMDLFDPADPYFNSGMLVIDTKKWRDAKVLDHLAAKVADGTMDRIYYDQDFLNLTFKNNWCHLDQLWNLIDPRAPHQALNPKMVHYTGRNRPWNLVSNVAFARVYRHVMTNELFYRYWRHRLKRRVMKFLRLNRLFTKT
ncbi:glycosyltransferase family 8 protein [Mariluticola halotolerans]|uniref:glycosyltransferase family 8 protein n=1 Tax=Mariluticola halotolerans TaxID=2909283 RepID=UPI0026E3C6B2|nr:glycosyltransferase family 8 protein [Mariluticola halotolerans]UJQ93620.1 glycosyltransferase family 8 protein [Mariluticola halotolerans]